jgi:hypothetical protein
MDAKSEIASLRDTLRAIVLSRPRRTVMQDRWIRLDRKASLTLSDPRTESEISTVRRKIMHLIEAMRCDPYTAGERKQRVWARVVATEAASME